MPNSSIGLSSAFESRRGRGSDPIEGTPAPPPTAARSLALRTASATSSRSAGSTKSCWTVRRLARHPTRPYSRLPTVKDVADVGRQGAAVLHVLRTWNHVPGRQSRGLASSWDRILTSRQRVLGRSVFPYTTALGVTGNSGRNYAMIEWTGMLSPHRRLCCRPGPLLCRVRTRL